MQTRGAELKKELARKFHDAVANNDVKTVRSLLENNNADLFKNDGVYDVDIAVHRCNAEMLDLLIFNGFPLDDYITVDNKLLHSPNRDVGFFPGNHTTPRKVAEESGYTPIVTLMKKTAAEILQDDERDWRRHDRYCIKILTQSLNLLCQNSANKRANNTTADDCELQPSNKKSHS